MSKFKFKPVAVTLFGATVVTSTVAIGAFNTDAATQKVKKVTTSAKVSKSGKLMNTKTGKVIKGIVSYKGKVYKDGKKATGVVGGTFYKNGKKATGLSKGVYYKNGTKGTGTYKGIQYSKGSKSNGLIKGDYYQNGKKATAIFKGNLYIKGQLNEGYTVYKGKLYNGTKENTGLVIYKGKLYDGVVLNQGPKEVDGVWYDGSQIAAEGTVLTKPDGTKITIGVGGKIVETPTTPVETPNNDVSYVGGSTGSGSGSGFSGNGGSTNTSTDNSSTNSTNSNTTDNSLTNLTNSPAVQSLVKQQEQKQAAVWAKKAEIINLEVDALDKLLVKDSQLDANDVNNYKNAASEFTAAQQAYETALAAQSTISPQSLKIKKLSEVKTLAELKEIAAAAAEKLDTVEKQILAKYDGYSNKTMTDFILDKGVSYLAADDQQKLHDAHAEFGQLMGELSTVAQQLDEVKPLLNVINEIAPKIEEKFVDQLNSTMPYEQFIDVSDNFEFAFDMYRKMVTDQNILNQMYLYTSLVGEVDADGKYKVGFGFDLRVNDNDFTHPGVRLYESNPKYVSITYADVNAEAKRAVDVLFRSYDKDFIAHSINDSLIAAAEAKVAVLNDGDLKTTLTNRIKEAKNQQSEESVQTIKRIITNRSFNDLVVDNLDQATKTAAVQNQLTGIGNILGVTVAVVYNDQSQQYDVTLSKSGNENDTLSVSPTFKLNDAMASINAASNATDMQTAIEANATQFSLNTADGSDYSNLSAGGKTVVANAIFTAKTATAFTTADEVKTAFDQAVAKTSGARHQYNHPKYTTIDRFSFGEL